MIVSFQQIFVIIELLIGISKYVLQHLRQ